MEKYCKSCGAVFNDLKFKICPHCGEELSVRYGRQPIPRKLRHEVFMRDGYRCRECGASKDETSLEIDHIVPVARGGTNDIDNLQTLCRECNRMKHTDTWVGGETNLESLEKQLSQLKGLLNDKESLLSLATTEKEEITIKYEVIKLNEKIQDVEEEIKSEEKKIEDNITKKKEAETKDLTYKWLYTSVSEKKLSLLCDLLMIKYFNEMKILTNEFAIESYGFNLFNYSRIKESWFEDDEEKMVDFIYHLVNPFKGYYSSINYSIDIVYERHPKDIKLFKRADDIIPFDSLSPLYRPIRYKYDEMRSYKTYPYLKERYIKYIADYFSLDTIKELIKEIDEFINKFNKLGYLKDMFLYNSKDNVNNYKLRILYKKLNRPPYQLPFYKIKYIMDNFSKEKIELTMARIDCIADISANPIKIGVKDEKVLYFLFKELCIDDSFSQYSKFNILLENYSEDEIKNTVSYIEDIFEIIKFRLNNEENSDKSLDNIKYLNKEFELIKNEILEFNDLKVKLLNIDYDFLSEFIEYDGENDIINYLLLNYSVDDIKKMINQMNV